MLLTFVVGDGVEDVLLDDGAFAALNIAHLWIELIEQQLLQAVQLSVELGRAHVVVGDGVEDVLLDDGAFAALNIAHLWIELIEQQLLQAVQLSVELGRAHVVVVVVVIASQN